MQQHSWHGLAVANFFCGTTGAGLYAVATLAGWAAKEPPPLLAGFPSTWPSWSGLGVLESARLLGAVLVAMGLLAVGLEAGRPLRGLNVFRNVRRSWMSRESALAFVFMTLALLDALFFRSPWMQAVAACAGLGVAFSQGMVLRRAKGVPAWSVPIMPAQFLVSALSAGSGLWLLALSLVAPATGQTRLAATLTLVFTGASWLLWRRYLGTPADNSAFRRALGELTRWPVRLWIEGLGYALPAVLLVLSLLMPPVAAVCGVIAGASLVLGNLGAKAALILRVSFRVDPFDRFGVLHAAAAPPKAARAA